MRLLIATGIYPPDIGGPATYSKRLFDELPAHGIEVKVVSFGAVKMWPKGIRHIIYFFKVWRAAKWASIVYAQDPVSVGLPALYAARLRHKPFYLKIVGDYAWEQGTQRYGVEESLDTFSEKHEGYPFFVRMLKHIESYVAVRAEKIIVPSQYLRRVVSNWGIDPQNITVIYNSFDLPEYEKVHVSEKKGRMIISIGRLVAWKGFEALIELMPDLAKLYSDVELHIVGDGPDREKLEALVHRLRLQGKVVFRGRMPRSALMTHLARAEVFVLNTFYEGFSHQILESLALGTPVITTSVGGNVEIIENEKNGLLVKYNNKVELMKAITLTLDNPGLVRMWATTGREHVAEFTTEKMIKHLLNALQ